MTPPLCLNPRCKIPGRHGDGCDGPTCRGCLKGWAADTLRLCAVCTSRLGENPVKAAELWHELELVLKAAGGGEHASSKPGSGTPPRDAVVEMRAEIRHVLVSWAKLIGEQRNVKLPADDVRSIGEFVSRHAIWLAATEYAGEAADELAGLVSRAYPLAYPSGTRSLTVGPCPLCGGVPGNNGWVVEKLPRGFIGPPRRSGRLEALVRERDQDKLPSEVYCDMVSEHQWPATAWRQLDRLVMARKRAAA